MHSCQGNRAKGQPVVVVECVVLNNSEKSTGKSTCIECLQGTEDPGKQSYIVSQVRTVLLILPLGLPPAPALGRQG